MEAVWEAALGFGIEAQVRASPRDRLASDLATVALRGDGQRASECVGDCLVRKQTLTEHLSHG